VGISLTTALLVLAPVRGVTFSLSLEGVLVASESE
jgi:hypothetical protein